MENPRQLAYLALRSIHRGAFADVAIDRLLHGAKLSDADRRLMTELVYGSIKRMRSLDALIDQLAKKKAQKQPPDLRPIFHIGLYQLHYLTHIPPSAAVNTTVQLAKENGFSGLSGFVNGLLRQYIRIKEAEETGERGEETGERGNIRIKEGKGKTLVNLESGDRQSIVENLGILHSYPDWIIEVWLEQLGLAETAQLCEWMNQSPTIDLRINPLRTSIEQVETAMLAAKVAVSRLPHLPEALRLTGNTGAIQNLPGFSEGWWTIQDSSAQLVSYLLDPKPGEVVIDACAAPGGKTTHIAELMRDEGTVWACDKTSSRLRKLKENTQRLNLKSIQICTGDSRNLPQFTNTADRVLLDAPCSGLGTLHRHADARWRQTPQKVQELSILQSELLNQVATWVKPNGILVYATCTLHPLENENAIQAFLSRNHNWQIEPPPSASNAAAFVTLDGTIKVFPHRQLMDGFFMVRLHKTNSDK